MRPADGETTAATSVRGNESFGIDGTCAWIVQSGSVALFYVQSEARRYLCTVSSNEAILWKPSPLSLIGVALEDSVLIATEHDAVATHCVHQWAAHLRAESLLPIGPSPASLSELQDACLESRIRDDALREQEEGRRFLRRQDTNGFLVDRAIRNLASLTDDAKQTEALGSSELLAAAQRVGAAQGITIRSPGSGLGSLDPLRAILDGAHIYARRVALSGAWWTQDIGPLLGFRAGTRTPVAIIPIRESILSGPRFELFDKSGDPLQVDSVLAAAIDPSAWIFYRPLPDEASNWNLFRSAFSGLRRDWITACVAGIGATLLGMITAQASLILMDYAIPDADRLMVAHVGLGLLAATIGALLFDLARAFSMMRLEIRSMAYLQWGLLDRLLKLSPVFFRTFATGDLASRVQTVAQLRQLLNESTISTILVGLISLISVPLMFYYSAPLALAAVAIGIGIAAVSALAGRLMVRLMGPLQDVDAHLVSLLGQLVSAISKLRIADAVQRAFAVWAHAYTKKLRLRQRLQIVADSVRLFGLVMAPLSLALLFWLAAPHGMRTTLTLGEFVAFYTILGIFLAGVTALGDAGVTMLTASTLWRRMEPILSADPEVDSRRSDPGELKGNIDIDTATFRYRHGGPLTLDRVSIRAEAGECVAIVGPSGSGKSTLINLLLRFEVPSIGVVRYDGHDLNGLDIKAVRRQLGVVTQDNKIMAGSIYDNITCGCLATLEETLDAARAAGLEEDLEQMPMGLHTMISEMGGNISVGQRQRLLIARALLQKPRILILDEATSALDNQTQAIVTESLAKLSVTRIVVAHRLSTVRNADRIYVIESGRVVQEGKFEQLLDNKEGLFARLMQRQIENPTHAT